MSKSDSHQKSWPTLPGTAVQNPQTIVETYAGVVQRKAALYVKGPAHEPFVLSQWSK